MRQDHHLEDLWKKFCAGEMPEAPLRVLDMLRAAKHPLGRLNCASVLVDMAWATRTAEHAGAAVEALEEVRRSMSSEVPAVVWYNLGNAWYSLGHLRAPNATWSERVQSEALQNAKACSRQAVDMARRAGDPVPVQYFVNYANALDCQGRSLEAIEVYDQALSSDESFGMALCNKALAVETFADLATIYRDALYIWVYQMLRRGLEDDRIDWVGGAEARRLFQQKADEIRQKAPHPERLENPSAHPPADLTQASELERKYVELCATEHLFLNPHIHDSLCEAAVVDNIFIRRPSSGDPQKHLRLAEALTQTIEDHITARYLWVLAQMEDDSLERIGGRTGVLRIADREAMLRHGVMKASFRIAYGVLDKIAGFLNDYLDLGISSRGVYFSPRRLWQVKQQGNWSLTPLMEKAMMPGLAALYDIFLDFQENDITGTAYYGQLREIRHALTHRRLLVAAGDDDDGTGDGATIGREQLPRLTRDMLFLSRCAIMYLILFVDLREHRGGGARP